MYKFSIHLERERYRRAQDWQNDTLHVHVYLHVKDPFATAFNECSVGDELLWPLSPLYPNSPNFASLAIYLMPRPKPQLAT